MLCVLLASGHNSARLWLLILYSYNAIAAMCVFGHASDKIPPLHLTHFRALLLYFDMKNEDRLIGIWGRASIASQDIFSVATRMIEVEKGNAMFTDQRRGCRCLNQSLGQQRRGTSLMALLKSYFFLVQKLHDTIVKAMGGGPSSVQQDWFQRTSFLVRPASAKPFTRAGVGESTVRNNFKKLMENFHNGLQIYFRSKR